MMNRKKLKIVFSIYGKVLSLAVLALAEIGIYTYLRMDDQNQYDSVVDTVGLFIVCKFLPISAMIFALIVISKLICAIRDNWRGLIDLNACDQKKEFILRRRILEIMIAVPVIIIASFVRIMSQNPSKEVALTLVSIIAFMFALGLLNLLPIIYPLKESISPADSE